MDPDTPILVPEINPEANLASVRDPEEEEEEGWFVVTNANCSALD